MFTKPVFMNYLPPPHNPLQAELHKLHIFSSTRPDKILLHEELVKLGKSAEMDQDDVSYILDALYYRDARAIVRRGLWGSINFSYFFPKFKKHQQQNRRAFVVPFMYRQEILEPLIMDLKKSLGCQTATTSSFLEFIGGRGEGKSRTLLELPACGLSIAYINTRGQFSSGFPQRTTKSADFFEQESLSEVCVMAAFVAYLEYAYVFARNRGKRPLEAVTSSLHKDLVLEATQEYILHRATLIMRELDVSKDPPNLFRQQISVYSQKLGELTKSVDKRLRGAAGSLFEQARSSGIRFIYVFDHASRTLSRNWPVISAVLTHIPRQCGIFALRCSPHLDPRWPVEPDWYPWTSELFGPCVDSKLNSPSERIDYLGSIFFKGKQVWPNIPGAPGNFSGPLRGSAMIYADIISGSSATDVVCHIAGMVLQYRDRYSLPPHILELDLMDFYTSERCIDTLRKSSFGPFYDAIGCVYSTDQKTITRREMPSPSNALAASYLLSKYDVNHGFCFGSNFTEFHKFNTGHIIARANEQLQIPGDYAKGVRALINNVPPVYLDALIRLLSSTLPPPRFGIEEHLLKVTGLRTRMLSIVGCTRRPTREDLLASMEGGFGLFVSAKVRGYNIVFGATDGEGAVIPVFVRSFFFRKPGIECERVERALSDIDVQARKLGGERHVVLLFHSCTHIDQGFLARQTLPRRIVFEFSNCALSESVFHPDIMKISDKFSKLRSTRFDEAKERFEKKRDTWGV